MRRASGWILAVPDSGRRMRRLAPRFLQALTLALLALAWARSAVAAAPALTICHIDDRSGAAADTGTQGYRAVQLAVDEINAAGGIAGHQVQLIGYDGKTDPQLSASFAARCAEDDHALLIIGANPAAVATGIAAVANEDRIPFFVMGATVDKLTDPPAPWLFRFGPANRQDAGAVADLLAKQGFRRIAIINCSAPFGIDGQRAMVAALAARRIAVVVQQTYDTGAADLTPQLLSIRDARPDAMVIFPYPADGARVLRTAQQLNLRTPTIVVRSALQQALLKLAGSSADGVLVPNTVDPNRADVKAFFVAFNSRFGPHLPNLYPAVAYDAAHAAFRALAQPEVLKAVDSGNVEQARLALRDAVEKIGSFDGIEGAAGTHYQFSTTRHQGPPDARWFTFIEVAGNGTRFESANLDAFRPRP
ncbi:ABC transporter substrate-binding protein (plasmid) [Paraburkholderia sp. PREW-6R]|uniref:ABC transporter substrate-binding protein n=1 Tax=Paraburkholderia sp. PREW-6R TaxID=3141544 RepID=UPI0031F4FA72